MPDFAYTEPKTLWLIPSEIQNQMRIFANYFKEDVEERNADRR